MILTRSLCLIFHGNKEASLFAVLPNSLRYIGLRYTLQAPKLFIFEKCNISIIKKTFHPYSAKQVFDVKILEGIIATVMKWTSVELSLKKLMIGSCY